MAYIMKWGGKHEWWVDLVKVNKKTGTPPPPLDLIHQNVFFFTFPYNIIITLRVDVVLVSRKMIIEETKSATILRRVLGISSWDTSSFLFNCRSTAPAARSSRVTEPTYIPSLQEQEQKFFLNTLVWRIVFPVSSHESRNKWFFNSKTFLTSVLASCQESQVRYCNRMSCASSKEFVPFTAFLTMDRASSSLDSKWQFSEHLVLLSTIMMLYRGGMTDWCPAAGWLMLERCVGHDLNLRSLDKRSRGQ